MAKKTHALAGAAAAVSAKKTQVQKIVKKQKRRLRLVKGLIKAAEKLL